MQFHRDYKKQPTIFFNYLLSSPFIYTIIIPLVLLDFFTEIYHRVCFPLYHLPYVKRKKYIRIDRHKLSYLPWYEKLNCVYCSYANGWLHYASAIAGETEKYWCGIKHKTSAGFIEPEHQKNFLTYGDEQAYHDFIEKN